MSFLNLVEISFITKQSIIIGIVTHAFMYLYFFHHEKIPNAYKKIESAREYILQYLAKREAISV